MTVEIVNGWLRHPLFVEVPGHPLKVYTQPNTGAEGLACHSVVGEEADFLDGVPNRFLDDSRNADGSFTDYAAASCMFILRKRQRHVVMYPLQAATWTSGSRAANCSTWAMEAEGGMLSSPGGYSEPLTEHQIQGFLVIAEAWEWVHQRKLVVGETVRAHWQLVERFGGGATACESGRYRNAWARLASREDDMTEEQVRKVCEEFMGATFPSYLEAYFDRGFTAVPEPRKFWQADIEAALRAVKVEVLMPGTKLEVVNE